MRLTSINYLRAFTAFSVLLTHFASPTGFLNTPFSIYHTVIKYTLWSNGGLHFGVIIFVVMSGFLIHLTAEKTPTKEYLIRRFIRIYPLYIIASFVGLCISQGSIKDFFLNATLVTSVLPAPGPPGNEILSTVIVEMAIYIVYPFIRSIKLELILFYLLILYILNIIFYSYLGVHGSLIQRNLFALIFFWFIGAYGAHIFIHKLFETSLKRITILGVIVYLCLTNLVFIKGIHYLWSTILAVLVSAIIVLMVRYEQKKQVVFLSTLNLLGESAYSIYCWHLIILGLFLNQDTSLNSWNYLLAIIVTIMVSFLSYHFIEMPFNNLRHHFKRK